MPALVRYRLRWMLIISVSWTFLDFFLYYRHLISDNYANYPYQEDVGMAYWIRVLIIFNFSLFMAFLLMVKLRNMFRRYPLIVSWLLKSVLLAMIVIVASFILFFTHYLFVKKINGVESAREFFYYFGNTSFLLDDVVGWMATIFLTQVIIEIDQKYSPGVFWEILTGRYLEPRNEKRIILFLDLRDSTPIAERLGAEQYFRFIKDFIFYVSSAVLEYDGRIYQYVGDEVVVTWPYRKTHLLNSMHTVIAARRLLQQKGEYFQNKYGEHPDFRAGLHVGLVTIGEIGVLKKDLAISGEHMNITARIRTACSEQNKKFLMSEDYFDKRVFARWQGESIGEIALKGVEEPIQLFALKV